MPPSTSCTFARLAGCCTERGEPYVKKRSAWNYPEVTVGAREYFVIGDNRGTSDYGRTTVDRILGKVVF